MTFQEPRPRDATIANPVRGRLRVDAGVRTPQLAGTARVGVSS